jgi:hypothetical protein
MITSVSTASTHQGGVADQGGEMASSRLEGTHNGDPVFLISACYMRRMRREA